MPAGSATVRQLFQSAADAFRPILGSPGVAERWNEPSALSLWSVGGLVGHAARAVLIVEEYLDRPLPDAASPLTAVEYFVSLELGSDPGSVVNSSIRARGDETGSLGPNAVAERFDAALARLRERLGKEPPDRSMTVFMDTAVLLDEYLRTRVLELTVHTDDICVSCGLPTPKLPGVADANALMLDIAARRHGDLAVLRALARRERGDPNVLRAVEPPRPRPASAVTERE